MKLLDRENNEVQNIDFGIVEVGTTKTVEYQLLNDEGTFVDLIEIKLADVPEAKEVTLSRYQAELGKDNQASFTLTWTPTLEIKKGLQLDVKVSYRRLWK